MVGKAYSIVVPVYNEAAVLQETVPAVLAAIGSEDVEVVYVCNGCTDGSANIISTIGDGRVTVVSILKKNKLAALRAGEAQVSAFPRIFLDADCLVPSNVFSKIVKALDGRDTELVSPALTYDPTGASLASKMIADVWCELARSRNTAFQVLLAVSRKGRSRWGEWPSSEQLFADDAFVVANVPPANRRVLHSVSVKTYPPRTFLGWVQTRSRWHQANTNLMIVGKCVENDPLQFNRLCEQFIRRPLSVLLYTTSVLFGRLRSIMRGHSEWKRFRTTDPTSTRR